MPVAQRKTRIAVGLVVGAANRVVEHDAVAVVGPGFADQVKMRVGEEGRVVTARNDDLTGTYVFEIPGLAAGENPKVSIEFRGQKVREKRLSRIEGGLGSADPLTVFGLLLAALLLRNRRRRIPAATRAD